MSTTLFPLFCDNTHLVVCKEELSMSIIKNIICRLCLRKHNKLVNIFDDEDVDDTNEISRYIEIFFAVKIIKTDPFSTFVCKPCWDWIITLCKYRLQFRQNDAVLRSKKATIISEITKYDAVAERTDCHDSVKNILSQGININFDYRNINFDAKVDLSDSKISDEIINFNNSLQTTSRNIKTEDCALRSRKRLNSVHKRRLSDYYQYNCFPSDNEESIALNRSKRRHKRTKIFGDPFSLADEDADDSDFDPVFSILKQFSCESSTNTEILNATNAPKHLTTTKAVTFQNSNQSFKQCPKRVSAQKARENLVRWLNPKKSINFLENHEKTLFPIAQYQFQEQEQKKETYVTIKCAEKTWNIFANVEYKKLIS